MPLYSLNDLSPQLGSGAWAAPSADLIGDVRLGARASVWFGAVLRGDNTPLILGDETNFQDGSIGHSDADFPLTIGARILNGAAIDPECIVGAGALVTEGKRFERGSLIVGAPARMVRQVTDEERQLLRESAAHYAKKAQRYAAELRLIEAPRAASGRANRDS